MQKGTGTIHILIILAILVLAGGVGYIYLQSQREASQQPQPKTETAAPQLPVVPASTDDTSNWIRLSNSNSYEVSYPKKYQVLSNHFGIVDPAKASDISIQDIESPIVTDPSNGITHKKRINIRVKEEKSITSLRQYVEAKYDISRDAGYATSLVKKSIIDGREAYEFNVNHGYRDENGGFLIYPENRTAWIMQDNNLYWIMYPVDDPIFKEIISTFKFIK